MYVFESKGSRGALHAMVVGAFVAAALLFGLSGVEGMAYPMFFQLGAVICLVAAVYLTARFSLRMYRYAIEPSGIFDAQGVEQYDLVITEIIGRRLAVVCRVSLRDVDAPAVTVLPHSDKAARAELCRDRQVFRYINTPVSATACYVPLIEQRTVLIIPVDDGMVKVLRGRVI